MKKSLIALAVMGSVAGSAMAVESGVTIYGIIDLGLVKLNNPDKGALGGVGSSTTRALSVDQGTKSRLGFKGVEDLGGGLSAKFELEHRLKPDTGAINTSGNNQFWDKSIVAITSQAFGEVALGRDYVPTFYSQYLLDPWLNQGIAEIGGTTFAFAGYQAVVPSLGSTAYTHPPRSDNSVFYNAKFGGVTMMLSAGMPETAGVKRRYGVGVNYTDGPLFLTGSYDQAPHTITAGAETDDLFIIGGAYDFGMIKPRVSYARSTIYQGGAIKTNPTSITIAATIPMGNGFIKAGYSYLKWDFPVFDITSAGENNKQQKFSLGYEYALSKRTAIYTDATYGKIKGTVTTTTPVFYNTSASGLDLGIRHSF